MRWASTYNQQAAEAPLCHRVDTPNAGQLSMTITPLYTHGGPEVLDAIGPLWEQLRDHHAAVCPAFRSRLAGMTFSQRRAR